MTLFGLLTSGHINKYSAHHPIADADVVALAPRGNPADFIFNNDAKIDFIRANNGARSGESGPDSFAISRMNMGRQIFESYPVASWDAPQVERPIVHRQFVRIDIPRPKSYARGDDRKLQMFKV